MCMKTKIILSALLLLVFSYSNAQTYKLNKLKYDYHTYTREITDPYNPALCGVCSFFVPGLGQLVAGETGRGIGFFAGSVGCGLVARVGAQMVVNGNESGVAPMLLGLGGAIFVNIWSIVDAVKVAKVNNLYIRDKKLSMLDIQLKPYITRIDTYQGTDIPVGLNLSVRF